MRAGGGSSGRRAHPGCFFPRRLPDLIAGNRWTSGSKPALRTIDWNPDVRIAQKTGVSLHYFSGRNEIVCPELNLTSRNSRFNPENRGAAATSMGSSAGISGSDFQGIFGLEYHEHRFEQRERPRPAAPLRRGRRAAARPERPPATSSSRDIGSERD